MKQLIEFLAESIDELNGYLTGDEHDEIEKHDCKIAKEAYQNVLNFLQTHNVSEGAKCEGAEEYEIVIRCWDYPRTSDEPRIEKYARTFVDRAEAETQLILEALHCAEDFNFGVDASDAEEVPVGQRLIFQVETDAPDCEAVVRAWDGEDYWIVQKYDIVRINK